MFQFNSTTKEWAPIGQRIDGTAANDKFGHAVAISSDGLVVAAGAAENDKNGSESGHVLVFISDWMME